MPVNMRFLLHKINILHMRRISFKKSVKVFEVCAFLKHPLHCKTALKYLGGICIFIGIGIDSPCGCVIHLFQICPEDTADIISLRSMRPFLVVSTASDEQRTACLQIQQMWFLCCNVVRWER